MGTGDLPTLPEARPDSLHVGRWRAVRPLGTGGMGVVHEAVDAAGRRAALKVVSPDLAADPSFRLRFRREIDVVRRVSGAGVASVLDADPDAPQPWLAVELVPGPTLALRVAEQGPLRAELWRFAAETAATLARVHGAGVVHRDLKPSNVILAPDGARLIDFGIATAAEASPLTAAGSAVGSAGWMSPEQVCGAPVTPASDVFGWAALVAFAATGRPPFGTGRPEAMAYRIVHGAADLEGVPAPLVEILRAALVREPGARPTMAEVAARLRAAEAPTGQVVVAPTGGPPTQVLATQPVPAPRLAIDRSHRAWLSAVAATTLVLITGIAVGARWSREDTPDASGTVPPVVDASPSEPAAGSQPSTTTPPTTTPPTTSTTTSPPPAATADWAATEIADQTGLPPDLFACEPVTARSVECWSAFDLFAVTVTMREDGSGAIDWPSLLG